VLTEIVGEIVALLVAQFEPVPVENTTVPEAAVLVTDHPQIATICPETPAMICAVAADPVKLATLLQRIALAGPMTVGWACAPAQSESAKPRARRSFLIGFYTKLSATDCTDNGRKHLPQL